jgi:sulfite reductase alpha subunit-like flavoprotein
MWDQAKKEHGILKVRVNYANSFNLDESCIEMETPLLMISHGTSITPFVPIILNLSKKKHSFNVSLYYGIKSRHKDFLYMQEIESAFKILGKDALKIATSEEG